jgi:hypothetical protein
MGRSSSDNRLSDEAHLRLQVLRLVSQLRHQTMKRHNLLLSDYCREPGLVRAIHSSDRDDNVNLS